ncbi:MAG: FMN-binding protein [Alkalispirochaeta sp.]
MKNTMNDIVKMLLFLIIIGTFFTSSLVLMDGYTEPIIERNEIIKMKSGVLNALQIPFTSETLDERFSAHVEQTEIGERTVYVTKEGAVAVPYNGSGLWGPIIGVLAVDPETDRIRGLTIIQQEETPGLGGRIAEDEYLGQFTNKRFSPELELKPEGRAEGENEIDAITGATLSSKAFVKILNEEYSRYKELYEEQS